MHCTQCNSDHTQRLEVVFENGTQDIDTKSNSTGIGFGRGGIGIGFGKTKTKGTSQSKLAQRSAPPSKKTFKKEIIFILLGLFLASDGSKNLLLTCAGLAMAVFSFYRIYIGVMWNKNILPDLFETWRRSWLCNKCGAIYQS